MAPQFGEKLRNFLDRLEPGLRAYLGVGEMSAEWLAIPDDRRTAAATEFERLVMGDPGAWKWYRRRWPSFAKFLAIRAGRTGERGAPKKVADERGDFHLAKQAKDLAHRLAPGVEIRVRRRKAGGFASGEVEIAKELRAAHRYDSREIDAILRARTPFGAAARVLAERLDKDEEYVRAAVSRGRKLLPR